MNYRWLIWGVLTLSIALCIASCDRVDGFYIAVDLRDSPTEKTESLRNTFFNLANDHDVFCDLPEEGAQIYDSFDPTKWLVATCSQADTGAAVVFGESDCILFIHTSLLTGGMWEPKELQSFRLAVKRSILGVAGSSQVEVEEGPRGVFSRPDATLERWEAGPAQN